MGFSKAEEQAARRLGRAIPAPNLREMRPTRTMTVAPFLMSECPVLNELAQGKTTRRNPVAKRPAFLPRQEAVDLTRKLGCRLPFEVEWEYACRAGTETLFVFGDRLLPDRELARWLSNDFSKPSRVQANPFGLRGIFTGEWCADEYRTSLAPASRAVKGSYAIRSGGAVFWPWQDEEWVWCMSAMRMASKHLINGTSGLRLVHDLG
jgi:formylglycine-generating enzyme required for sulfatase activity